MPHQDVPHGTQSLFTSDFEEYEAFVAEFGDENATFMGDSGTGATLGDEGFDLDDWYESQGIVAGREPLRVRTWQDDQGVWHTTTFFDDDTEETRLATNSDGRSPEDGHPDWNMDGTPSTAEESTFEKTIEDYETTEEFKTLKAGFLAEMQIMGLDPELSTSLWDWVEGRFVEDASFTSGQAMIDIYEQKAF